MDKKFLLAVALLGLSANAAAQTASSTINVEIESRAITLVNNGGLNFGKVLPYGSAGFVFVATNGVGSASNAFISDATNVRASSWAVTGIPGAPFAVTLPTSVTISNGTENMTVSSFNRSGAGQPFLDAAGNGSFNVGARLNVGANQPVGVYTGTFNVTVSYN
jgi:spore coat protein U-like protein